MTQVIVLGGGMVGSVMALDLASDPGFDVTVADLDEDALAAVSARGEGAVATVAADCSDPAVVRDLVAPFDLVLGALPSRYGFAALGAVIEAGRDCCDISFMAEDALSLDAAAKARGVCAVVDCGVAPGMSNMLAGYAAAILDPCERLDICVGGLPRDPAPPFHYKAAFSPLDVIEEYTRPARLVENSALVVRPALSEPELLDLPGVGTLEAFNTDGLRTLVDTLDVPWMRERTLRHPEHAALMRAFRDAGLLDETPVTINGTTVRPVDLLCAVMLPRWRYEDDEADLTVMRVTAEGRLDGVPTRLCWYLLDHSDPDTGCSSMARTTAFPCTAVARLLADGAWRTEGVIPPERLGAEEGVLRLVLDSLETRGVRYVESRSTLGEEASA